MKSAPLPSDEDSRLKALLEYQVLDTDPESAYNDLTQIAAHICGTPISLVSLIDKDRQWFKARVGLDATETPRDVAFCAHALLQPRDLFLVEDTLEDDRFADNPLVAGEPFIRFYAGAPLVTRDGYPLGTLCVIDKSPRKLSAEQKESLMALARQVVNQLELRLHSIRLERMKRMRDRLLAMISHDLKGAFSTILGFAQATKKRFHKLDKEDLQDAIEHMAHAGHTGHEQLTAILEWSRGQMGDPQFQMQQIDLLTLSQEVIDRLSNTANNKAITLTLSCPSNVQITANKILLGSALQNLVNNAIKFSPAHSEVVMEIAFSKKDVTIAVKDSGVGMEAATAENLFNENVKQSTTGTDGESGYGLGTILIKDFVDSVSGSISVNSQPNQGTEIIIKVPTLRA